MTKEDRFCVRYACVLSKMAALERLHVYGIKNIDVVKLNSYKEVSEALQQQYPGLKGLSGRCVRHF